MRRKDDSKGIYVEYRDGEVVFREGSVGKQIYFILSGEAEISQRISGRMEVVAVIEKGGFFGEMAALNDDVRSITVTAIGDLSLHELSLDEMIRYMQSNSEILRDVCTTLAGRLKLADLRIREMMLNGVSSNGKERDWMISMPYTDRLNILVVDDEPNILSVMEGLLSDDYKVFTAPDGKTALQIMNGHDIALVIADHRMPEMTGTELLEKVKLMYPDTMRIILSGWFDQEILMKSIKEVQVHDAISKPWRTGEIKFTVARWVEQYRKIKQLKEGAKRCTVVEKQLEEKINQYAVIEKQLEEANGRIQQLTTENQQYRTMLEDNRSWYRRIFKKKGEQPNTEDDGS